MPISARGAKIILILCLLFTGLQGFSEAPEGKAALEAGLKTDVEFLSDSLCAGRKTGQASEAAFYIIRRMQQMGYELTLNTFETSQGAIGRNIVAMPTGSKSAILLMASYDGLGNINGKFYPGADSNASGVAALLALAERLKGRSDVVLAFVDGHNANMAGAEALEEMLARQRLKMVINLDILGSTLAPPDKFWKNYLIILGGSAYQRSFDKLNADKALHLYYNYYGSRSFTELFYRKVSDHKVFFSRGIPVLMFTSGITMNTNREGDTYNSLDYGIFAERVSLIAEWIETL